MLVKPAFMLKPLEARNAVDGTDKRKQTDGHHNLSSESAKSVKTEHIPIHIAFFNIYILKAVCPMSALQHCMHTAHSPDLWLCSLGPGMSNDGA